ncbi:MAG: hypothetical protein PHT95_08615 [Candidatus Omnitrophica bacterium]|nr:hypothetical protein [Candidatus Omnitrophota bacterium]
MAGTRKDYEPPMAYDISGAASGEVHAQVCASGSSPSSAQCKPGGMAGGACKAGSVAAANCQTGNTATSSCKSGGMPFA